MLKSLGTLDDNICIENWNLHVLITIQNLIEYITCFFVLFTRQ